MKIDKINKKILFELDKNCRISDRKLAKAVGRSKESIRYRIGKMIDDKLIQKFTIWVDPMHLGYRSGKIYLRLANVPERRGEFKRYILEDKRLWWLGMMEGSFNAGLTFFVKTNEEFFELKNKIFSKFRDLIIESFTATLVSVHYFNANWLYEGEKNDLVMFNKEQRLSLDDASKNILRELFNNSRIGIGQIAEKYDISVNTVKSRMKKLEQEGIITRYKPVINLNKLDMDYYKAFVYFKNHSETDLKKLMEFCSRIPNIRFIVVQISPWDIELEMLCKNYKEYNEIISRINTEFSSIIQKIETAIIGEDYLWPSTELILG